MKKEFIWTDKLVEEPKQYWQPTQGEEVWVKIFSNWSKGIYIGYDIIKSVHLVREDKEGGGNLLSSSKILPYYSMPNEPKQDRTCTNNCSVVCGECQILEPKQETLEEAAEIDLTRLCYYDRRNPDFQIKEEYGYDKEEVEATGNFAKKDCACDNCFYGRSKLTEQLIRQQERMYSEEDLKEAFKGGGKMSWTDISQETQEPYYYDFNEWFEQFKK